MFREIGNVLLQVIGFVTIMSKEAVRGSSTKATNGEMYLMVVVGDGRSTKNEVLKRHVELGQRPVR